MHAIMRTVGESGVNDRADVMTVQRLLNARSPGQVPLAVDGVAGPKTLAAIRAFQQRAGFVRPDGMIAPGQRTWTALSATTAPIKAPAAPTSTRAAASASRARTVAAPGDLRLSGARWWHANEARYPNSSSLDDLAPGFREQATSFVAALRAGGATVRVSATRRNATRAKLMHYSWTVAHGQTAPDKVPAIPGCDIVWDHGDVAISRAAAREMARLFHIAYKPSLTSNHIRGTAVDMTITRPAKFSMTNKAGKTVSVGSSADLHAVGASYGVHKLLADPPHWSADGH